MSLRGDEEISLCDLKEMQEKAYSRGIITREKSSEDLVFYWVTQWQDDALGVVSLQFKGEFNILRKAGRQIMSDLRSNPVQVDFEPIQESRNDSADLLDGIYRADDRVNTSLEAYDNGSNEAIVAGVGAWELCAEYERPGDESRNQVIRRKPIYEANNNVFWDPDAKLLDKSDANYVCILEAFTHEGYEELVYKLTGRDEEFDPSSFAFPEESYTFPWIGGDQQVVYVGKFYVRQKVTDTLITFNDPLGNPVQYRESMLDDVIDDLIDAGYEITDTMEIERYGVTKYIASGAEILATYEVSGEHIPVVPVYGERAYVEGEEHYEGITRLAKDPQRLRNFQMSYLADIVSRSPRPKPIFTAQQIQGFEFMYEENGADSNYPYLLQHLVDKDGKELPLGPAGTMPEQPIPQALAESLLLTRQAVEDVANPGLPQDIADPDLSGKAVALLQNRLDQQSMVYQQNMKHAKRRDGEIYASMASELYDAPREVTIMRPDGSRDHLQIMETVMDKRTGELVVLNDVSNSMFNVYSDIGPSYSTKKEQTLEQLDKIGAVAANVDPMLHKAIVLKQLVLIDGVDMEDIRTYANNQLVISGFREPESEEEMELLMQAQNQPEQPDPAALLAMAEMLKGQAAQMREQRQAMKDAADIENDRTGGQIDMYNAETQRMKVQVDAQEAGASTAIKQMDSQTKRYDALTKRFGTQAKSMNDFRSSVSRTQAPSTRTLQ